MKQANYILDKSNSCIGMLLLAFSIFLAGCSKEQTVDTFDTQKSYIYFGQPNTANRPVELYIDSISYSFAMDNPNLDDKTFAIPVRVAGDAVTKDRSYSYTVTAQSSNLDASLVTFSEPVIRAGK